MGDNIIYGTAYDYSPPSAHHFDPHNHAHIAENQHFAQVHNAHHNLIFDSATSMPLIDNYQTPTYLQVVATPEDRELYQNEVKKMKRKARIIRCIFLIFFMAFVGFIIFMVTSVNS